jgi:pyrrolidone-carboxylate peptidase/GNAT superfamily N-acetyltransferase
VLPTEFGAAAARLAEAIAAEGPDAVVMLGVAGPGPLRLERLARNASREGRPDAAGRCQGPGAILEGAPAAYASTLPLGALFRALEAAGLPAAWSDDAGGYVCNDLFFRIRHDREQAGAATPCGFLHLPPAAGDEAGTAAEGRLSLETMERGVRAVLETLARRLAGPAAWQVEAAPSDFADWPGLLGLLRRSFAAMEGRIDPPSSLQALSAADLAAKARGEQLLLVRDATGAPLACAFLAIDPGDAWLSKIAVEPSQQGRGLAWALLAEAERAAAAAGCAALALQTRVELLENHRIFEALGFRRVGETSHPGYDRTTSLTFSKPLVAAADGEISRSRAAGL